MVMSLVWFIIVGLICGFIARALFPGKQPMGLGATAVLGMAGSLLGGLVGSMLWGGFRGACHSARRVDSLHRRRHGAPLRREPPSLTGSGVAPFSRPSPRPRLSTFPTAG